MSTATATGKDVMGNPFRMPPPSGPITGCTCQQCEHLASRKAMQAAAVRRYQAVTADQVGDREVLGEYTYQGKGLGVYKVRRDTT